MSQVAVVIGGGQTLGEFLCHGLAAEGYRVAVVDIQSEKAARVADTINTEFGEGMAYGFGADATSEQSVMALARGVDEIFAASELDVMHQAITWGDDPVTINRQAALRRELDACARWFGLVGGRA